MLSIQIPPSSYLTGAVYVWAFWLMVPFFAMAFSIFGARNMWVLEKMFYKQNARDNYLFNHFDKIKLQGTMDMLYRLHPLFAGMALVTSYMLMYTMNSPHSTQCQVDESENPVLLVVYMVSSSLMAYFGGKLSPHMFGNASAKRWTFFQSQLVYLYNTISIVARLANLQKIQILMNVLSFSLLICAGVLERFYVLFLLPWVPVKNEHEYRTFFSYQFKGATITSWILGVVYFMYACN